MTKELPPADGALSPLGSSVRVKSRIDLYFASFVAELLRAMRRNAARPVPRAAPVLCGQAQRGRTIAASSSGGSAFST
jgi:hypothetical protein